MYHMDLARAIAQTAPLYMLELKLLPSSHTLCDNIRVLGFYSSSVLFNKWLPYNWAYISIQLYKKRGDFGNGKGVGGNNGVFE